MPVLVVLEPSSIIRVRLSGKVGPMEWQNTQQRIAKLLPADGQCSILVIANDFEGWEGNDWGDDMSFRAEHDRQIERMAIVAPPERETEALMVAGKGLRRFEIQFFPPPQLGEARAWVTADRGAARHGGDTTGERHDG